MQAELKESIESARRLAANGEFAEARKRIESAARGAEPGLRNLLHRQTLTLEVLEGIDVVRQLMADAKHAKAAKAAERMLGALDKEDYSRLGIAGAAMSLLTRANSLARRIDGGDRTAATHAELEAFVDHLGAEIDSLRQETVDRVLETAVDPARGSSGASTLGDLLNRKPWRSGLNPAVEPPRMRSSRRETVRRPSMPVAVLEEEPPPPPRAPAPSLRRPAVQAAPAESMDVFEQVSRASLDYWHVVLFAALVFAAAGYLGTIMTNDRYESEALLRKSRASTIVAPITNRPADYLPFIDQKTVETLVRTPEFHQRVSRRLVDVGWARGLPPHDSVPEKNVISPGEIAASLTVRVTDTGNQTYLIAFTAQNKEALKAQQIAGAAADEYRVVHIEEVTRQAARMEQEYKDNLETDTKALEKIREEILAEFQLEDAQALGKTVDERIDNLLKQIQKAKDDRKLAEIELKAAQGEYDTQVSIRDRLPQYDEPARDARIEERVRKLTELESDLRELRRRVEPFGPEHADHKKVSAMEEEVELLRAEIKELEENKDEGNRQLPLNRERAYAEDRVARAQGRMTLNEGKIEAANELIPKLEAELARLKDSRLESSDLREKEKTLVEEIENYDMRIKEINSIRKSADLELSLQSAASEPYRIQKQSLVGIAIGVVVGLVVGIASATGIYRRRQVRRAVA